MNSKVVADSYEDLREAFILPIRFREALGKA
jgi:hypothetical protein